MSSEERPRTYLTSKESALLEHRCEEQEMSLDRFSRRFLGHPLQYETVKKSFCIKSNHQLALDGKPSLVTMTPLEIHMYREFREPEPESIGAALDQYTDRATSCRIVAGIAMVAIPVLQLEHGDEVQAEDVVRQVIAELPEESRLRTDAYMAPLLRYLQDHGFEDQSLPYFLSLFDNCLRMSGIYPQRDTFSLFFRNIDYQSSQFTVAANAQRAQLAEAFFKTTSLREALPNVGP